MFHEVVANQDALDSATAIREKEFAEFNAEEKDFAIHRCSQDGNSGAEQAERCILFANNQAAHHQVGTVGEHHQVGTVGEHQQASDGQAHKPLDAP